MAATYIIVYDDGKMTASAEFRRPERLAEPGDVFEAMAAFSTLGQVVYAPGDRFHVLERTRLAPFHRTSSLGNLLIRCKAKTSVWTEFDASIAEGRCRLVLSERATG